MHALDRVPELGAAIGRLQTSGSDGYAMVLLQSLFGREARARVRVDGLELVDAG